MKRGHARLWARWRVYVIPLVVLLCLTLPHLGQGDWRKDSGRYAAVGVQMLSEGPPLSPRLAGEAFGTDEPEWYFNKPPLLLWVSGAAVKAARVVGADELVAARLTSVLAAGICVLSAVWLIGAFHGRGVMLVGGVVLSATYEFFRRTREVSLDLWQLAFLLIAAGLIVRAARSPTGVQHGQFLRPWVMAGLAGVFVGLALMTKPLVGLVVLPLLGVWMLVTGRGRGAVLLLPALVSAAVVAVPWHAYMAWRHGAAFTGNYFGSEVAERAAGAERFAGEPWWFYFQEMGQTYWPWLPLVVIGLVLALRGRFVRGRAGPLFAVVWFVGWLGLITAFPDRAPRYALPLWPAGAWLVALVLTRRQGGVSRRVSRRAIVPATGVFIVAAVVFALLPVRVQRPPDPGWAAAMDAVRAARAEDPGALLFGQGVDTNERGRFYLEGLGWPVAVRADQLAEVPSGALIVRTDETRRRFPGERVVVREGRVTVTTVRDQKSD